MPPRAKTTIRAGADDSEDDLATAAISSKSVENIRTAAPKMPRGKATTRRTSAGKTAAKRKVAPKQPRQALKDRTNIQDGNETEEVEDFEDEDMADDAKPKAKRARTAAAARKNAKTSVTDGATTKSAAAKRGRAAKRVPTPEPLITIPETQPDPEDMEDVEQSIEVDPDNMNIEDVPTPPRQAARAVQRAPSAPTQQQPLQPRPSTRAGSAQPSVQRQRERSGSVSGAERRGTDPELRRQFNELTTKYENLHLKYECLQELGKSNADTNFEKLKRASDQKAKDADDLITSLKKELVELKKSSTGSSSETVGLQKQVSTLTASNERLAAERDDLKSKLQVSQNETKSLEAKLVAARQQISNSAMEAKAQEKKFSSSVSINSSDAQKEAKMKENLYADLTGLIVRNVKRNEGEDVYDCIQTGRNGTLHFHLSIANDTATPRPKTPSGLSYEETEFAYEPLLDESRDRELLDMLPDYLTEEICFPRNHAQRFYSKVVDSMTKKIILDDED